MAGKYIEHMLADVTNVLCTETTKVSIFAQKRKKSRNDLRVGYCIRPSKYDFR